MHQPRAVPAQFPQQAPTSTFPGLSWGEQVPLPQGTAAQLPAAAVQQALVQACAHTCTCRGAGALLRQQGREPSCQEPLTGPEQGEQGRPRPGSSPPSRPPGKSLGCGRSEAKLGSQTTGRVRSSGCWAGLWRQGRSKAKPFRGWIHGVCGTWA